MLLSNVGSSSRRASVNNVGPFNLNLPDLYSDAREHGYNGPTRHVRLPRATNPGGGAIAKGEDGMRCVVAGRESLRILRMTEISATHSPSATEYKSVTGRGGHRIEASRNFWEGSGLKVDSSSTDVVWCYGAFSNKILTSARNGELIMWDLNKNGPSKYERRIRDHARSIHALQYSPPLQSYCITGSADGDIRIWDIRDLTKSIMRIHHGAPVRAVAFSPISSQSKHVVAALDNGSIHRWDLNMGQRGQIDRIPVAHSGPVLSLDWVSPSSCVPATLAAAAKPPPTTTWYGGSGGGFFDDILPSVPIAGGNASGADQNAGPGWLISGGIDRCVKVWDLAAPVTRREGHRAAYSLHTSFPVRRVLWRPGYETEVAIVSNADLGAGGDFGHGALSGGGSTSSSAGLTPGMPTMIPSPRLTLAHLGGPSGNGDGTRTPDERSRSVASADGCDPVEIWDVRRGYIAKWVVNGSIVDGGVTDIEFGDSHALWALHTTGTFSQLDLRQSRRPIEAIPRSAISWNTTGSIAFVTDRPKRWEVPYDDVDPDSRKEKKAAKSLGDQSYRPSTQTVGAFAHDGADEDMEVIEKLARGYIYVGEDKQAICVHNAQVAADADALDAAQTWSILESLLMNLVALPTPAPSPVPLTSPPLTHAATAPAAIPTLGTLSPTPSHPHRPATSDATTLVSSRKGSSPGSMSKNSDGKPSRSTSGHRSPHGVTPTSSNASSPRKSSTGLPSVPAAIFARRESGAGLPPPLRPRLPSSFRRPSFTHSAHSGQSETPSDGTRSHLSLNHKQYGEGALDDSDSDESGSDAAREDNGEAIASPEAPHTPGPSARSPYGHAHRASIAHPSPLSRLAMSTPTWTDEEHDDASSPSPASTSDEDRDFDRRARESDDDAARPRRPSMLRLSRRSSARSRTRSRSSTVASFVASPSPASRHPHRGVVKQDSQSSIRTVTAGESTPAGTLSRAEMRRDDTIRDLAAGGRPASAKASSLSLHHRARSEALSSDVYIDGVDVDAELDEPLRTAESKRRSQSTKTREAVNEVERRLRQMAWATMRERFEQYADEGDVIMCAMLCMVAPTELMIPKSRVLRFVEAYIDILSRLRLYTCAAYIRKFSQNEEIRAVTTLSTTIYSTCKRCRKPILQPAAPLEHAGHPSGSYSFCMGCKASITKCSICHLPVRALMYQCPVCAHGGHRECYVNYYSLRPVDKTVPPALPPALHRAGRSMDVVHLERSLASSGPSAHSGSNASTSNPESNPGRGVLPHAALSHTSSPNQGQIPAGNPPPRGRALSRANSTTMTVDGESDDGAEGVDVESGAPGSYGSAIDRGPAAPPPASIVVGRLCAAGCGHYCWTAGEKRYGYA